MMKSLASLLLAAGVMVSSVAMAAPTKAVVKKQGTKEKTEMSKTSKTTTKADGTTTAKTSKKTVKKVKTTPAPKNGATAKKPAAGGDKK